MSQFHYGSLMAMNTLASQKRMAPIAGPAARRSSGSVCRHLKIAGRIVSFMISSGYQAAVGQSCHTTGPFPGTLLWEEDRYARDGIAC